MDAIQAIHSRRSVRDFTSESVEDSVVEELMRAAMAAPSANNGRPWRFIVLRDQSTREQLAALRPGQNALVKAPLGIVVLAEAGGYPAPWWAIDCSLAAENLILAAEANGLGTVWIGVWPEEEWVAGLVDVLGIPEGTVPFAIIAMGHPVRKPDVIERYNPEWVQWR